MLRAYLTITCVAQIIALYTNVTHTWLYGDAMESLIKPLNIHYISYQLNEQWYQSPGVIVDTWYLHVNNWLGSQ